MNMTKNQTITLKYILKKETPGTFVYQEVDQTGKELKASEGATAPTFYVRKTALGKPVPEQLTVTITS